VVPKKSWFTLTLHDLLCFDPFEQSFDSLKTIDDHQFYILSIPTD